MGVDFDLITILRIVESFDKFKKVYFDDAQLDIFNSVANPVVKLNNEEDEQKSINSDKNEGLNKFVNVLALIADKGVMSVLEKKILAAIGLDLDLIKNLAKEVEKEKSLENNSNRKKKTKDIKEKDTIPEDEMEKESDRDLGFDDENAMRQIYDKFGLN